LEENSRQNPLTIRVFSRLWSAFGTWKIKKLGKTVIYDFSKLLPTWFSLYKAGGQDKTGKK
jgi:hypothetical protein